MQLIDDQWVKGKTGCGQAVKAIFGWSKILTAVAALDTAPTELMLKFAFDLKNVRLY